MKLYIKNMVCDRCKMSIADLLQRVGLQAKSIELGEVDFGETKPSRESMVEFEQGLAPLGFAVIDDKKGRIIEKIKGLIIELVHSVDGNMAEEPPLKTSEYLSRKLHYDYKYLSHLFSTIEGVTIEQYLILQKIERAKELLVYDEITLTEIAYRLGYSSVAHLSRQFKKTTGLTPSYFREIKDAKARQTLDKV